MLASLALLLLAGSQLAPASALPRRLDSPLDRRAPPSLAARRPKPPAAAQPLSPRDIQGSGWLSSYDGQTVNDVQGIVTAKSSAGFYIQSVSPDKVDATSEGLYIYGSQSVGLVSAGDLVSLSGTVSEYASDETYLHLTEVTFPTNVTVLSSGHTVAPVVLGVDRTPPGSVIYVKDQFELTPPVDVEQDGDKLKEKKRGLDFWESLENMLVKVPNPRALGRTDYYNELWIVGADYATHANARGGLTTNVYPGGWDSNPEAITLGKPLDGGSNPKTAIIGTELEDIVGILSYSYGFPMLFPLTSTVIKSTPTDTYLPSDIQGDGQCTVALANYNVYNLNPKSKTFAKLADHITNYMNLPDVVGLEEIQDDSGSTNNGVTTGNQTLQKLIDAIKTASGGVTYAPLEIAPIDLNDGGQPGGNIRPGLIYRTDRLELDTLSPAGTNTESQSFVRDDKTGETTLALNPGLIDPTNPAWSESRKPLTASFFVKGSTAARKRLHVIVAHFASKSGSGTTFGRYQTAENGAVEARIQQAEVVGSFVQAMQKADSQAKIVLLGDLNEFNGVQPIATLQKYMTQLEMDDKAEQYSYQFDQNSQQIDHIFATKALAKTARFEILHVNTWTDAASQASDHDPLLASINVC